MSLTSTLRDRRFRDLINPLVLQLGRLKPSSLPVLHASRGTPWIVGTAFDYMVRFELQRRIPGVVDTEWVAEGAVRRLDATATNRRDQAFAAKCRQIINKARTHHARFIAAAPPRHTAVMIRHAVALANLDGLYRSGLIAERPERANFVDCDDVSDLLRRVPWDWFVSRGTIRLNPTFGDSSAIVGGADCDIIAGTTLVELKTNGRIEPRETLQQLVGYLLLASAEDELPFLRRFGLDSVAIYYARCEQLVQFPAYGVFEHPQFREIRATFLEMAGRATRGESLATWTTRPEQLTLGL